MGDYKGVRNTGKSAEVTHHDASPNEIKEEWPSSRNSQLIGSQSPTATVLQAGSSSPRSPSKGQIRLRPLQALINCEPTLVGDAPSPDRMDQNGANKRPNGISDSNWRSGCRGVREKLRFILDHDNSYHDVTFVVGKFVTERISGHKLILRLGSSVFEKAFSALSPSNDDGTVTTVSDVGEIIVPEVEPFAFRYLLKYIYTDEFDPTGLQSSDIMAILQGAKLFEILDLVHDCVQSLKSSISDDNVVALCELARDIDDFELRDLAISYICKNAGKILTSSGFLELTYPSFLLIIENDDLELEELLVFKTAVEWGQESCRKQNIDPTPDSLRTVLDEILYKIRFPIMSAQEFSFEVRPTKVLSSDELVEVLQCFCLSESMRDQLEPMSFSTKRRNHMAIKSESGIKEEKADTVDFKTDPSDSPHCQPTLATNLNEITETESEDTSSHVSSVRSHSSSNMAPSKKRSRIRSPSPGHSKSSNKSKPSPSSRAKPGKTKKRKSIDFEKDIHLQDCEIELNQFILECSTNPRRKEIESIRLSGIKVTDHDKIQDTRVRLPKLKDFHLDIRIPTLKHSDVNTLAGAMILEEFLFFSVKTGESNWTLNNIWSLGVNISLVINGITMLKVDLGRKQLIINKLKDASNILSSTRGDAGVKSVVLSHPKFPGHADLFPSSLERLVLLSIAHIPEVNKFLRRLKKLKEICLLTTEMKKINLSEDFSEKLRKLSIGSAKFSFPLPAPLNCLEELFLWRCEWTSAFEENFHLLFPNLKKISFFGSKVSPKLLKKILKIKTIQDIGCGIFDWSNPEAEAANEMKLFIVSAGLEESEKGFVLTKTDDSSCWEGKKGSFELSQEEIYKNFQFCQLYMNYETFRS